jgi:hypothetical protein
MVQKWNWDKITTYILYGFIVSLAGPSMFNGTPDVIKILGGYTLGLVMANIEAENGRSKP